MLHLWSSDGILADGSNHGRSFSLPPYDVGLLFPLQTFSRMGIVMEVVRSTFTVLLQKTSPKIKVFSLNDATYARTTPFFFPLHKGRHIVGYAFFFFAYSSWMGRQCLHLEDVYVEEGYRRMLSGHSCV